MEYLLLLAEFTISPHWIVGFIGAAGVVIISRMQKRSSARRMEAPQPAPVSMTTALAAGSKRNAWEVEMHELARDLTAQLDTKIVTIQQLLQDVDARCNRLEILLDEAAGGGRSTPQTEAPERLVPTSIRAAPKTAPRASDAPLASRKRPVDEIYSFSDYGLSPFEISQRVGAPVGEVELILNLRDRM